MKAPIKYYQGKHVRFTHPDQEWLEYHYWKLDKSLDQIAAECECTRCAVKHWMKKIGMARRSKQECAVRHSIRMSGAGNPAWNGGISRNYHASIVATRQQVCEWCNTRDGIQVHHRDHDITNGDPDNLALLCHACNRVEAYLWALQQDRRADILITEGKIEIRFRRQLI